MELAILEDAMCEPQTIGNARFSAPTITVREVIRARVELYLEALREQHPGQGSADVMEGGRGFGNTMFDDRAGRNRDRIVADAEQGFVDRRYFLLLDDRQAEHLDQEIDLAATTAATFLLITPLRGG